MIRVLNEEEYPLILELGKMVKKEFSINSIMSTDTVIVYEKDNKIVGFLVYSRLYETIDILYLAVQEKCQRMGIGRELVEYLTHIEGVTKIMLEVRSSNEKAINFYEHNGFKTLRIIKNYYDNEDGLSMERSLL